MLALCLTICVVLFVMHLEKMGICIGVVGRIDTLHLHGNDRPVPTILVG